MAGEPDLSSPFLTALSAVDAPSWSEPGDLSRMSIEAFSSVEELGRPRSIGALRLSGAGVSTNAVRLELLGSVSQEFQRLVVAVGAALEGARTARGKVSEALARQARLLLVASPAPGSVLLRLTPEMDSREDPQAERLFPMGSNEPLADRSIGRILALLNGFATADPEAETLSRELNELGPRVAGALRDLAGELADGHLDVDLAWSTPSSATRRTHLSASQARWVRGLVSSRRLDETPVSFVGQLRTISDRRALELETVDGDLIVLRRGRETPAILEDLHVGSLVSVDASEKSEYKVGGEEVRTYTLISLSLIEEV
jgi:hypothetical protein